MIMRRDESVKMKRGMMMTLVVVMMVIHHTSADLSTLIQETASSLKERPERAALEPPTVTSLKPSDRTKGGGRGLEGISVREQSGGHIPPVVASRSPSSSSSSRDFKNRYMHINTRFHQPRAPVATASSGSRSGSAGIITGRRPLSDTHHPVPAPSPHLVNGTTTVSIPHESYWVPPVSYAPPPPRNTYRSSPIARSYPRRPRIHEDTVVPAPSYIDGHSQDTNPYHGGGVWGQREDESTGGLWGDTRRHPSYSQGHPRGYGHSVMEDSLRTDTFGHRLSEDLSHLSSEYPPRRSNSRRTQVHHPIQSADIYSPSRGIQPQEEDVHIINQNHNRPRNGHRNFNIPTHTVQDREEPYFPHPRGSETTSSVRRFGMPPTTYGSGFDADRMHTRTVPPKDDVTRDEFLESHPRGAHDSQQNGTLGGPHPDPVPSTSEEDDRRPLTLHEIWHMTNLSNYAEFVEFLQRKGITVREVLNNINEGATREQMFDFLDKPDLTTTVHPSPVLDERSRDSDVHEITEIPVPSAPVSATEEIDDVTVRHSAGKSRGGKKKNRKKGRNKKRGRKNREDRKRGRKDRKQTNPDILYTTVIPPVDLSGNGSLNQLTSPETNVTIPPAILETSTTAYGGLPSGMITQEPPSPTVPILSTNSTLIEHPVETVNSTKQPIQSQLPTLTVPLEQTTAVSPQNFSSQVGDAAIETTPSEQLSFNESAVLELPDLSSWPLSATTPVPTSAPTLNPILSPTTTRQMIFTTPQVAISPALLTTEFTQTTKTTPLPIPERPRAGSLTLPPASQPSEVSIVSFTVMKVPEQNPREETQLEDVMPTRKRQHHRKSHKRPRKFPNQRMDNQPRILSSMTPKKIEDGMVVRTPFVREESKDKYTFPVKGFMIITGIMGALAVFTLVVLISYAIIKCSKQPVVNNYQVSEQKTTTQ